MDTIRILLDNVEPIVRALASKLKNSILTATSIENALYFAIREVVRVTISAQWGEVLEYIVKGVLSDPTIIKASLKALQFCFDKLKTSPAVNEIIIEILERCLKALGAKFATTTTKKIVKEAAKDVVEEVVEEVAKEVVEETAKKSAQSAFISSAVIDVTIFGISAAYNGYNYQKGYITREQFQEHMTKRTVATGGSIAGTTIGAGIGTLILPGLGTFVGSFIGGIAGDVAGSRTGTFVYDRYFAP